MDLSDHVIFANYICRIIIFSIVLYFGIKYRDKLVIVMAISYALSLIFVIFDVERIYSLLIGMLSACLTAWYIIKTLTTRSTR